MTIDRIILWEAHRGGGGGHEMPESCMMSFEYAWFMGGIPEADVNMTSDGIMISLHDPNIARITNAPPDIASCPVNTLTFEEVRRWDVVSERFSGLKIPTIPELFERLRNDPAKQLIIDYKRVDLELLAGIIKQYGVGRQITFACSEPAICSSMKALVPEIRIKLWIGGCRDEIVNSFKQMQRAAFMEFEQIQLHLNDLEYPLPDWRYQLDAEFLQYALAATMAKNTLLQVLPWQFEHVDISRLMDIGIRSYAVDFPNKFSQSVAAWFAEKRTCD